MKQRAARFKFVLLPESASIRIPVALHSFLGSSQRRVLHHLSHTPSAIWRKFNLVEVGPVNGRNRTRMVVAVSDLLEESEASFIFAPMLIHARYVPYW